MRYNARRQKGTNTALRRAQRRLLILKFQTFACVPGCPERRGRRRAGSRKRRLRDGPRTVRITDGHKIDHPASLGPYAGRTYISR